MIIGINGYIGSGKDTIGHIIQDLTNTTWEIKKFAAKLKQIASLLTGIPVEKFEDQEFKKSILGAEWDRYGIIRDNGSKIVAIQPEPHAENSIWFNGPEECKQIHLQMTVREMLQKLGTEAIRDGLHTNAWVNALFADYQVVEDLNGKGFQIANWNDYPNWIITDCRFPNEAKAIKDRGGKVIRVNRGQIDSTHPSETSLDNWEFDYVIDNNEGIKELTEKVRVMLKIFNVIS